MPHKRPTNKQGYEMSIGDIRMLIFWAWTGLIYAKAGTKYVETTELIERLNKELLDHYPSKKELKELKTKRL